MTLSDKIKKNPYLKVSNCMDLADVKYAISCLIELDEEFGKENKTLIKMWDRFLRKKKKLEQREIIS